MKLWRELRYRFRLEGALAAAVAPARAAEWYWRQQFRCWP
jgi:hypothetical protein